MYEICALSWHQYRCLTATSLKILCHCLDSFATIKLTKTCTVKQSNHCHAYLCLTSVSKCIYLQSTLVISTSLISNNRLSQNEILVCFNNEIWQQAAKYCGKEEISPLSHNNFNTSLTSEVKLHIHLLNVAVRFIVFLNSANLICRGTNVSKCFRESLGIRDNESWLYLFIYLFISLDMFVVYATHCSLNRLSHTIYWKSPISILGSSGYEIYIFLKKNG